MTTTSEFRSIAAIQAASPRAVFMLGVGQAVGALVPRTISSYAAIRPRRSSARSGPTFRSGWGFLLIGGGAPVVVLIDGVGRAAVDMIAVVGHDRRDELEVGILRPDRVEELGEAVVVVFDLSKKSSLPISTQWSGTARMAVGDAAAPHSYSRRR